MNSISKRISALLIAAAMLTSVFAGCGSDTQTSSTGDGATSSTGTADTSSETKDSVIIATANETPSMHPYDHNATAGSYMNQLTYDTLFVTDMELVPQPLLVESYESLSETEWQFTIKDNVMFHNGEKMTTADIKASLDFAKTFAAVGQYTKFVGECEIIDELTFKLITPEPYANLLMDLAHHGNAIVPKSLIDAGNNFNENPIGSGPYKFVNWSLGEKVEFVAFEDYFLGAPAIANMTWRVIPEGSSRTIALETGEIDAIIEVESNDAGRIEENPELKLFKTAGTTHNYIMINHDVPAFGNEKFREAINYALNRDDIITVALNGLGIPAVTQTPIGLPGTSMDGAYTYDIEKAKTLLAESGVDPSTVEMPIICSDDTKRRAAEVIQAALQELGITVTIVSMDLATYLSDTTDGNYVAAIGNFTSSSNLTYMSSVFHSSSINASNRSRLNNPQVDALIDQAATTIDEAENVRIMEEVSALLNDLSPQITLYQFELLRASDKDLMGFECSPSGYIDYAKIAWA